MLQKEELYAKILMDGNKYKSRLGGNPPILIEDDIPEDYVFYMTIENPENKDKMISIAIQKDFEVLIENNLYPNVEIKVIEHDYCEEGQRDDISHPDIDRVYYISPYTNHNDFEQTRIFPLVKYMNEPELIQYKSYYMDPLKNANYSFFLQIDEYGYNMDYNMDNVFNGGSLYLYKHNETGEIIAGFWQYS